MIDAPLFCKILKFVAHAAGKKDVRYYLNGVRLEVTGDALTMCGTDGSRIAICVVRLTPTLPTDAAITLPNDGVKRLLSAFGKAKGDIHLRIDIADSKSAPVLTAGVGGATLQVKGLDGVYPNVRRAIPAVGRDQGAMPHLDAKYLSEACASLEPMVDKYKQASPLCFDSTGKPGDTVVIRPSVIRDSRVAEVMVVIAPILKYGE